MAQPDNPPPETPPPDTPMPDTPMPDTPTPEARTERPIPAPGERVALVLAGGGIPGWMYEIGALTALDEFLQDGFNCNNFDLYVGTSAGSVVASLMVNGARPREVYDAIAENAASPYNIARKDIYTFGTGETWRMLGKGVKSVWAAGCEGVLEMFVKRRLPSVLDMLWTVQDMLPSGVFTLRPLENTLARHYLSQESMTDDFRELRRPLFIPAVDLDRGNYVIFGTEGRRHVPISRAVVASCSMPVLFQPVHIDGVDYIDGGTGRVANMSVAVDNGAGLLVVINPVVHLDNDRDRVCLPTCHGFCKGIKHKGLSFVTDQAMRINTSMRLRDAKSRHEMQNPGLDIAIIEPDPQDTVMFAQNVMGHDTRHEVMRYGYRSTVAFLARNFEHFQKMFAKRGVRVSLERFRWRPKSGGMRVLGPHERERVPRSVPVTAGGGGRK
ncbi:MAG: patatin-like phospholipase family protein [Nitrospirota bacterium]|nr:patatin-like phospholipase family protein [Nitrospirota bacterium]